MPVIPDAPITDPVPGDELPVGDPTLPGEVPAPGTDDEVEKLPPNPGQEPVIR